MTFSVIVFYVLMFVSAYGQLTEEIVKEVRAQETLDDRVTVFRERLSLTDLSAVDFGVGTLCNFVVFEELKISCGRAFSLTVEQTRDDVVADINYLRTPSVIDVVEDIAWLFGATIVTLYDISSVTCHYHVLSERILNSFIKDTKTPQYSSLNQKGYHILENSLCTESDFQQHHDQRRAVNIRQAQIFFPNYGHFMARYMAKMGLRSTDSFIRLNAMIFNATGGEICGYMNYLVHQVRWSESPGNHPWAKVDTECIRLYKRLGERDLTGLTLSQGKGKKPYGDEWCSIC